MSSLVTAIQESIRDREISSSELGRMFDAAKEEGVSAAEVQQIVNAFQSTESGFTPQHRAQLWVAISGLTDGSAALQALERSPAQSEGAHRLVETQARLRFLAASLTEARQALEGAFRSAGTVLDATARSDGRISMVEGADPAAFEAAKTTIEEAQAHLLERRNQLTEALNLDTSDRDALLASLGYSERWTWRQMGSGVDASLLAGMPDAAKELLTAELPKVPTRPPAVEGDTEDPKGDNFAGIRFSEPVAWTFNDHSGELTIPEGTTIVSLPDVGNIEANGRDITLPSGSVLDGSFHIVGGKIKLDSYASLKRDGIRIEARQSGAEVSFANGILSGGPGLRIDLPVKPMPEDVLPAEAFPEDDAEPDVQAVQYTTRELRFALTDSTLPDGVLLMQGQGSVQIILKNGEPFAILEGSVSIVPGATLVRSVSNNEPLALVGHGGTAGELRRGGVALKNDKVIGFARRSEATIDGLTLSTSSNDMTTYKLSPPSTYDLGPGVTIKGVPSDRDVVLRGDNLKIEIDGLKINVAHGGVQIRDGRLVSIEPGTEVVFNGVRITTGDQETTVLEAAPNSWPRGNAIYVTDKSIGASGKGISIEAAGRGGVLGSSGGRSSDAIDRVSVQINDGKVRFELGNDVLLPTHLVVDADGDVNIVSGAWTFNAGDTELLARRTGDQVGGRMVRIRQGGHTYEIDPRPMWPGEDGTLRGRFREVPFIEHAGRWAGANKRQTTAILRGRQTLERGARGDFVKSVQGVLAYYLGDDTAADGAFGPLTQVALQKFQRLHRLDPTGVVDAATMRALDAAAPPDDGTGAKREKIMVMVALNGDVPDELRRFRELAAERGARPIIVGHPDGEFEDMNALRDFFAQSERGEIDFDWLVISGHSGGGSTWGSYGTLDYDTLTEWSKMFPRAAAQIEKMTLLNCYNVTVAHANGFWPELFPNITGLVGFMYSAPGKKAQSSDEMLLYSGRLLATIGKGEVPDLRTAKRIGSDYAANNYIKWQNASAWIRYRESDGSTDQGHFAMTSSARWEMRRHGAGEELEVTAFAQRQTYQSYFDAQEAGFEEPPPEHHTGPLREYLNAVDTVLGTWEQRLRSLERYRQRQEDDPTFEMPEEYQRTYGWERDVNDIRELRSQILFLIYSPDIRKFFDQRYGNTITAFNQLLADNNVEARFPQGDALRNMNRKDTLAMLVQMKSVVDQLPSDVKRQVIDSPDWHMMTGTDANETAAASPRDFIERAIDFLKDMKPQFIAVEWL